MEGTYQTYRRNDRLNCSCAFAAGDQYVQIYHDIDAKWVYLTYDNWREVVIERASDHMTVMKKVGVRADCLGSNGKKQQFTHVPKCLQPAFWILHTH